MITFKQFLNEEDIDQLARLIEKDCGPFLKESGRRGLLFRGVQDTSPENAAGEVDDPINEGKKILYWKKAVRKDRRPKDTPEEIHNAIDEWFENKFGFKARSQTMFVFGQNIKRHTLSQYGKGCIVFPIGPIKYAWSNRIYDLYAKFNGAEEMEDIRTMIDALERAAYTDDQLSAAVKLDKEIMMECSGYYAFDISAEQSIRAALQIY